MIPAADKTVFTPALVSPQGSAAPKVTGATVNPAPRAISFTALATGTVGVSAAPTGGGSGNTVVFSADPSAHPSSGTGGAPYPAPTCHGELHRRGRCVIDANQGGNADRPPHNRTYSPQVVHPPPATHSRAASPWPDSHNLRQTS
jgi:hypothetical protein